LRFLARLFLAACGVCLAHSAQAQSQNAQSVEQFYKGRTIRVVVGSSAGGGTDIMARLLSRYMGKYIPGSPSIVVQNQPGAGGIVGANRIANTADRDGSEFATMERAIPQFAIMGDPNARFDPLALTWLGSLSSYRDDAFMLVVNANNGVLRAEELRQPQTSIHVGASQQGSTNLTFAVIAKEVLGLNVEAISGYAGTAKIALAMQSGEVDGELIGIVSIQASQRHMWAEKLVRPLVQFARKTRHPDLPDVPTGRELVRTPEGMALLEFAELPFFMAQSFVAPAGVPPERAQALRSAFMSATRDPDYVQEARKLDMDNSPIDHLQIENLLRRAGATPKTVLDEFQKLVNRK
jgi:tripartite-type tricarboxylate transporter receptor subunit TctC